MRLAQIIPPLATFLLIFSATPAHPEVPIKAYREALRTGDGPKESMETYVMGVGRGYVFANYEMSRLTGRKMFCPPDNAVLQGSTFLSFLEADLKGSKLPDDIMVIELVLLDGIQRRYPCRENSR